MFSVSSLLVHKFVCLGADPFTVLTFKTFHFWFIIWTISKQSTIFLHLFNICSFPISCLLLTITSTKCWQSDITSFPLLFSPHFMFQMVPFFPFIEIFFIVGKKCYSVPILLRFFPPRNGFQVFLKYLLVSSKIIKWYFFFDCL